MRPKGAFFVAVVIESASLVQYDKEKQSVGQPYGRSCCGTYMG